MQRFGSCLGGHPDRFLFCVSPLCSCDATGICDGSEPLIDAVPGVAHMGSDLVATRTLTLRPPYVDGGEGDAELSRELCRRNPFLCPIGSVCSGSHDHFPVLAINSPFRGISPVEPTFDELSTLAIESPIWKKHSLRLAPLGSPSACEWPAILHGGARPGG